MFAVLVPAAVAGSNQFAFSLIATHYKLQVWFFPWMALTTALLGWCAGYYLHPQWLRWTVFAWCLVLLDLLTIAAFSGGSGDFAFMLVSAQLSLIVLWTILADVNWQWRLPGVAVAASAVALFAGIFLSEWSMLSWGILMVFAATVTAIVCAGLRWFGFTLQQDNATIASLALDSKQSHQFGLKHMLIWAAAMAPVLLVARGVDVLIFADLDASTVFRATLLSVALATVNLAAIWAVLGTGIWPLRIAALLLMPLALAEGLEFYTAIIRPPLNTPWPRSPLTYLFINMEEHWRIWLCSSAALLAALLLFLRASGYRLLRNAN